MERKCVLELMSLSYNKYFYKYFKTPAFFLQFFYFYFGNTNIGVFNSRFKFLYWHNNNNKNVKCYSVLVLCSVSGPLFSGRLLKNRTHTSAGNPVEFNKFEIPEVFLILCVLSGIILKLHTLRMQLINNAEARIQGN